jgi:hypothetical protein
MWYGGRSLISEVGAVRLAYRNGSWYHACMAKDRQDKPGPKPDHLKLEGYWEEAMKKALKKEKPKEGWPDEKDKPKKK